MGFLDLLGFGAELVATGSRIKSEKEFKQSYPEDYPIHQELFLACVDSKFDFKLAVGAPVYAATMLLRGLLNSPQMKCYTFVNPEAKIIEVIYEPVEAVLLPNGMQMRRLLNWVNSQLFVGRFYPSAPASTLTRSETVQVTYRAAVSYQGMGRQPIKRLAGNLFLELAAFYDLFIPAVKALVERRLSFGADGQLQGPVAAQIMSQQAVARQQLSRNVAPGALPQLLSALQQGLDAGGFRWEMVPGRPMVRLLQLDEMNGQAGHYGYITEGGELVLEARSAWVVPPAQIDAVVGSKYLLFLNLGQTTSGAYFLDPKAGRMAYRTGLNAANMQLVTQPAFNEMMAGLLAASHRLSDLGLVAGAGTQPAEGPGTAGTGAPARGMAHEQVGAAVAANMRQAGYPLADEYVAMLAFFGRDVGHMLVDIAA